jgi:hypothetical protein
MLKLLLYFLAITPLSGLSQEKAIKIHVTLTGVPDNTKYYLYRAGNLDSAVSQKGKFDLVYHKFSVDPEAVVITTGYKEQGIVCWIENEDITISSDYAAPYDMKSTGSATQKEFEKLIEIVKPDQLEIKDLKKAARAQKDTTKRVLIQRQLDSLQLEYKNKIQNFISTHPKSSVSTFILAASANEVFTKDEALELYFKLDKAQQESESGKSILRVIEMLDQLRSGK